MRIAVVNPVYKADLPDGVHAQVRSTFRIENITSRTLNRQEIEMISTHVGLAAQESSRACLLKANDLTD